MSEQAPTTADREWQRRVTQAVIRLSLLALLAFWCFLIVSPFVGPIVGAIVIAISVQTPYVRLSRALGDRPRVAAALLTAVGLLALVVPTIILGANLAETAVELSGDFARHELKVPPPPERVSTWPVIGERLYDGWLAASQNLEAALMKLTPYLKSAGLWLVSTVGDLGRGLLMFVVAIVIAGVLLPYGRRGAVVAERAASIVAGERGPKLAALVGSSVQGVTRGVIGVAVIQAFLGGMGMLIVGVPAAGLWALLILLLAVMQLPTFIVLLPIAIYVFSTGSTLEGVFFAIWAVLIGASDNVLKPLLMGRGSTVPMLVLFLGSLGGFISSGILGLFVGAVVLSIGYTLFMDWLESSRVDAEDAATASTEIG